VTRRTVVYVKREHPKTALDELIVVDEDDLDPGKVRIVRELGEAEGKRFVEAALVAPVPEWDARWTTLTLDRHGPFADLLVRHRVVAYVTRERAGRTELLTIEAEEYPEEPVQVPAGRIDFWETLEGGLRRELAEETGLTEVRIVRELPGFECTYRTYSHNHAFHAVAEVQTPDEWRHRVAGKGADSGLTHICRWLPLTADLRLWGAPDPMLRELAV
jgi:ADP-ribose pyrophosphatase YjhB (NUDIX family)